MYKRPVSCDSSTVSLPFSTPIPVFRNEARSTRRKVDYSEKDADGNPVHPDRIGSTIGLMIESKDFHTPFKPVMESSIPHTRSLGMIREAPSAPRPLHNPSGEGAIVLYDPTIHDKPEPKAEDFEQQPEPVEEQSEFYIPLKGTKSLMALLGLNKPVEPVSNKVPVVIDPRLTKVLRPHQVEGVKFLYRCTTGLINPSAHGCIMADEMGLGKTLQCITLLWTLLRQSPVAGTPTIEKCIIICPSSLVRNWANELVKWLGKGAVNALVADGKSVKSSELSEQLKHWGSVTGRLITRPILIISYETLRLNIADIENAEIGLLLADEGHRLKNGDSLTFTALNSLNAKRRVILSGTPIQNDLSEYYSLVSFANPGLLGTPRAFHASFERFILKARDSMATAQEVQQGDEKLKELLAIVNKYIIRRTNDILSKYLPVKYEHVVFCNLSPCQQSLYEHFVNSKEVDKILSEGEEKTMRSSLNAINTLRKLCMHPDLVNLQKEIKGYKKALPPDYTRPDKRDSRDRYISTVFSSKLRMLERMLAQIKSQSDDKIVLISNFTTTLDMVEKLCRQYRYGFFRLDGTMAISKRQKLVDNFNDPTRPEFVFLLSSKAGGCGINLIGANRLILLDPDWNPACDQQALARVWRDGQKKDCFVYRFIATGTIEEKIFQRQTMKQSLSTKVVDDKEADRLFSFDSLRQLFEYQTETLCETHDTFNCNRCNAQGQVTKADAHLYGDATTWNHFTREQVRLTQDKLLASEESESDLSFVFQYISH